jgi:hypothetical protein
MQIKGVAQTRLSVTSLISRLFAAKPSQEPSQLVRTRSLLAIVMAMAFPSCAGPTSTNREPTVPEWKVGPGCTIYTTHRLSDVASDITAERFAVCPLVVYDSVLVR